MREFLTLFAPILLMTFTNELHNLVEKIFLAKLSSQALEAAITAVYTVQIFQLPCLFLVTMAQVFVGRCMGEGDYKKIGPIIWQFLWFSCLSMVVVIPLGFLYGNYYFHSTAIAPIVISHFYFLLFTSFLLPFGAALSCFFLGQGKTRLVVTATMIMQVLQIGLSYLFIFGSWGLLGGPLSVLITRGGFCLVLLGVFFFGKKSELFQTRNWTFKPKLFWDCIRPGMLRAFNRILNSTSWASTVHLLALKGESYLLVVSLGGTLFLFLPFFGDAVCQTQITINSQLLGAKKFEQMRHAFYSSLVVISIFLLLLAVPFLVFPQTVFYYLFENVVVEPQLASTIAFGVWVAGVFFSFSYVPISYVLAFKDTGFSLFMGFMSWVSGYMMMYIALEYVNIQSNQFWLVSSLMQLFTTVLYFLRMRWLLSRAPQLAHA